MQEDPLLPELWSSIFELGCTDDGTTGISLSLVSKSFNTLSAPFKLQSVSIQRVDRISLFLGVLENSPAEIRCIQYLNIGLDNEDMANFLLAHDGSDLNQLYKDIRKIFGLCAHTLLILSVRLFHAGWPASAKSKFRPSPLGVLPEISMPVLRELTWIVTPSDSGKPQSWSDPTLFESEPLESIRFPSLEAVYIETTFQDIHKIAYHVPNLRFLRSQMDLASFMNLVIAFSGLNSEPHGYGNCIYFPTSFREMLVSTSGIIPIEPFNTPPSVFLHILDMPTEKSLLTGCLELGDIRVKDLKMALGPERVLSFSLAQDSDSRNSYWQERVLGGEGCWRCDEWTAEVEPDDA